MMMFLFTSFHLFSFFYITFSLVVGISKFSAYKQLDSVIDAA